MVDPVSYQGQGLEPRESHNSENGSCLKTKDRGINTFIQPGKKFVRRVEEALLQFTSYGYKLAVGGTNRKGQAQKTTQFAGSWCLEEQQVRHFFSHLRE